MRTLRLLLWFCLGLLIGGYSVASHAATPWYSATAKGYKNLAGGATYADPGGCLNEYKTANPVMASCSFSSASYMSSPASNGYWGVAYPASGTRTDNISCSGGPFCRVMDWICPSGGTLVGNKCQVSACPSGSPDPTTGQCSAPSSCTGDQKLDPATNKCKCDSGKAYNGYTPATGSGALVCFNGCESQINNASNQYAVNGQQVWKGSWNSTGAPCVAGMANGTPNPATTNPGSGSGSGGTGSGGGDGDTSTKCPGNKVPGGTINGKVICIDPSPSNPSTNIGKSETDPDGPGSTPGTTITKKIECDGANCTTTTTTQNGDGTSNTKTDKQDQKSFCESNPNLTICKDSEATAGASCSAPPTCKGDAVTCAILKQQWTLGCMYEVETAESATYSSAKAGTDGFDPDKMRSNAAVVNVSNQFDTSHFLNSSCPQAKPITVMGQTVSLPFDASCEGAVWMGRVAVAMTLVMAAIIVIGGIK